MAPQDVACMSFEDTISIWYLDRCSILGSIVGIHELGIGWAISQGLKWHSGEAKPKFSNQRRFCSTIPLLGPCMAQTALTQSLCTRPSYIVSRSYIDAWDIITPVRTSNPRWKAQLAHLIITNSLSIFVHMHTHVFQRFWQIELNI